MRNKSTSLILLVLFLLLLIVPQVLLAAINGNGGGTVPSYPNSPEDVVKVIENFRDWFARIIAVLGVVVILYAAFLYMTAGGDEEKVAKAKKTLMAGVIGVALAIIAYGIFGLVKSFLIL